MSKSLAPLIAIAEQAFCHFTDVDGQAFAKLRASNSDGFHIHPLRSREYREWFFAAFYGDYNKVPSNQAFHALLHHLEAQADADDRCRRFAVFRRVGARGPAPFPNQILLDLANPQGEFVEISASGWRTTTAVNVNIQTSRSSDPLPAPNPPRSPETPQSDAPSDELASLLNVASRPDYLRCLAWLLSALRPPITPYPVLILQGPPSSGKSFAARILRSLIDPSAANLTPVPSSVRQLFTLARDNWILALDHISHLPPTFSDALCRLSAGAGVALRETASRATDPVLQTYKRPILLTVTDRFSCPADLAERALTVTFAPLPPERRRPESDFQSILPAARPRILATLCHAVSTALRRLSEMPLTTGHCPDALAWALAAAPALGYTEDEMRQALNAPPPSDPTVEAARALVAERGPWTGTATELLDILPPSHHFRTAKGLSQHLKSHTLPLSALGISLQFTRPNPNLRLIHLTPTNQPHSSESPPPPEPPASPFARCVTPPDPASDPYPPPESPGPRPGERSEPGSPERSEPPAPGPRPHERSE